jgi:hypothetical protein
MSSKANDQTCYIILLLGVNQFQISSKYMNCNPNQILKYSTLNTLLKSKINVFKTSFQKILSLHKIKIQQIPILLGKKNGLHDNIQAPYICHEFYVKTIIPTMFLKTQIFLIYKSFFLLHCHYNLKVHKSGIFGQCFLYIEI